MRGLYLEAEWTKNRKPGFQPLTGKSHAMPMARAEAEKATASILVLSPE